VQEGPCPRRRRARVRLVGVKGGGSPPSRSDAGGALDAGRLYSTMTAPRGGADPLQSEAGPDLGTCRGRVTGSRPAASSSRTRIGCAVGRPLIRSRMSEQVCAAVWCGAVRPHAVRRVDSVLTWPRAVGSPAAYPHADRRRALTPGLPPAPGPADMIGGFWPVGAVAALPVRAGPDVGRYHARFWTVAIVAVHEQEHDQPATWGHGVLVRSR
jgi:hypothetical protein